TRELVQARQRVTHVIDRIDRPDQIEAPCRERWLQEIGLQHRDARRDGRVCGGGVSCCQVDADDQTLLSHLAGEPFERLAATAARVEHAHAWRESKAAEGLAKLALREQVEQAQLARVVTGHCVTEEAYHALALSHHDQEVVADRAQQRPAGYAAVESPQSLV